MPDPLEALFDQLRGQLPPVAFAPPALVRRRGRQRAHRQALAGAAIVLAVTGGVGGLSWLVGFHHRPPTDFASPSTSAETSATPAPTASPSAAPTDVPPAAILRPSDLGAGKWTRLSAEGVFKGEERWYWADLHEGYRADDYPSRGHQLGQVVIRYEGAQKATVEEIVERYDPGWGARNVTDIETVVAKSGATPYARPGSGAPLRHKIIDREFAGDESLLIEQKPWSFNGSTTIPRPRIQLIAVVRVDDLVATVIAPVDAEPTAVRTLAVTAAARLG